MALATTMILVIGLAFLASLIVANYYTSGGSSDSTEGSFVINYKCCCRGPSGYALCMFKGICPLYGGKCGISCTKDSQCRITTPTQTSPSPCPFKKCEAKNPVGCTCAGTVLKSNIYCCDNKGSSSSQSACKAMSSLCK